MKYVPALLAVTAAGKFAWDIAKVNQPTTPEGAGAGSQLFYHHISPLFPFIYISRILLYCPCEIPVVKSATTGQGGGNVALLT